MEAGDRLDLGVALVSRGGGATFASEVLFNFAVSRASVIGEKVAIITRVISAEAS